MMERELFDGFALGAAEQADTASMLLLTFVVLILLASGQSLKKLVHPNNHSVLILGYSKTQKNLLNLLRLGALLLLVMAVLRPKWGYELQDVKKKGVDIVVAVDVSQSMLARDLTPDRLEAARRKILDFLTLLKGDRVALVAFAGAAYPQCPLTEDYQAFRNFLELLDTELIPVQGTSLADAIEVSRDVLGQSSVNSRAIVFFTDGEEHDPEGVELAREVGKTGIRIFTIGVGSVEGVPVPQARNSTYNLRDASGNLVVSRLNESALQEIAEVSGGIYQRISVDNRDLESIYTQEIRHKLEEQEFMSTQKKIYQERYLWLALPAFLMLCIELIASFLFSQKIVRLSRHGVLCLVLFLCSGNYWAESLSSEREILNLGQKYAQNKNSEMAYNLGHALYRNQDFLQARQIWEQGLRLNPAKVIEEKLLYSLGNASFYQGDFLSALSYWQKLLEINPEHAEGKSNLELLMKLLQKKQQDENKQNNENNESEESEEQKDQKDQKDPSGQQDQKDQKDQSGQQDQKEGQKEDQKSGDQQEKQQQSESKPEEQSQEQSKKEGSSDSDGSSQKAQAQKMSEQEAQRFLNRLPKENLEQMKRFIRFKLRQKEKEREEAGKPARDLGGKAW